MSNKKDFFWPSYVDLMTNLFAVMLVLFVLSFIGYKFMKNEYSVLEAEYEKIKRMSETIRKLDDNKWFVYDSQYQKHILTLNVNYQTGKFLIPSGLENQYIIHDILDVGRSILTTIIQAEKDFRENESGQNARIKFLVVIEGQSSSEPYKGIYGDAAYYLNNEVLSYNRALYLKKFWEENSALINYEGLTFDDLPNCEIVVSGSGTEGRPREPETEGPNPANQRFLVHIVPVLNWS